jgi:hypothetical protein
MLAMADMEEMEVLSEGMVVMAEMAQMVETEETVEAEVLAEVTEEMGAMVDRNERESVF